MSKLTKIKAGIVGSAGFTGGELIRLLLHHPFVEITFALSRTFSGKKVTEIHQDLIGETDLVFSSEAENTDVIFLCLPHQQSKIWLQNNKISPETKIIDLGNDFRIENDFGGKKFVYGLPEFQKEEIKKADFVANPGCFATAIQLAILPLIKNNGVKNVYVTGITGSTGAGKELQETTNFSWRNNNISAYKTLTHQHLGEIKNNFQKISNQEISVHFVPWRGNFARGIFTSSIIESEKSLEELFEIFEKFYQNSAFTFVSRTPIDLKQVINTNKCLLNLEKTGNQLVVHSAIDNLLKGASGQAVQNMNLMFGFDEKAGLYLKPSVF